MILPTIHSNGTGPQYLLDGYRNAMEQTQAAIGAIQKIEFNARDYYPQGPDAWNKARAERREVYEALQKAYEHLLAHAIHINDIMADIEQRRAERMAK